MVVFGPSKMWKYFRYFALNNVSNIKVGSSMVDLPSVLFETNGGRLSLLLHFFLRSGPHFFLLLLFIAFFLMCNMKCLICFGNKFVCWEDIVFEPDVGHLATSSLMDWWSLYFLPDSITWNVIEMLLHIQHNLIHGADTFFSLSIKLPHNVQCFVLSCSFIFSLSLEYAAISQKCSDFEFFMDNRCVFSAVIRNGMLLTICNVSVLCCCVQLENGRKKNVEKNTAKNSKK